MQVGVPVVGTGEREGSPHGPPIERVRHAANEKIPHWWRFVRLLIPRRQSRIADVQRQAKDAPARREQSSVSSSAPSQRSNQLADIFNAPGRGTRPELDRLREAPGLDAIPPEGFANWEQRRNWRYGLGVAEDLRQAKESCFWELSHVRPSMCEERRSRLPCLVICQQKIQNVKDGIRNFWRWFDEFQRKGLDEESGQGNDGEGVARSAEGNSRYFLDNQGRMRAFYPGTCAAD